ncbi:MAG: DUF2924 domain-containing protein [Pirellulaceae bacterium]
MAIANSNGAAVSAPTKLNVEQEVAALQRMSTADLREKYEEVFGEACRSRHKQYLVKRIAWRMQANLYGGLSERALQRAAELANDADLRLTAPKPVQMDKPLPMAQSELTRIYKGRKIVVRVLEDGFEYDGQHYSSLSAVARVVTGSHWSGNRFFGLQQKGGDQ